MWIYSGSLKEYALGVVGVSAVPSSGIYSKAVAKLAVVTAVSGMGESSAGLCFIGEAWAFEALSTSKGFETSRATLITRSNRDASSAVGSK